MSFLPPDYQPVKSESNYLKLNEEKTYRIRILSDAVVGWEYWVKDGEKNKPVKTKEEILELPKDALPDKFGNYIRHFWAFTVYNYEEGKVQILELTQKSIQDALYNYEMDMDWGDVKSYDIKITRSKEKDKVKYSVSPAPKTELFMEVANAYAAKPVNLEALFDGTNPFGEDIK